jgi:tRNA U34 2-thiouridine synthase MnmA/TrmU
LKLSQNYFFDYFLVFFTNCSYLSFFVFFSKKLHNQFSKFYRNLVTEILTKSNTKFTIPMSKYQLLKAKDPAKDQSYFLWQIKKEQLSKILLPVGEFENKAKVREFAEENGLITAAKKDSQGLCFVGQTSLSQMLLESIGRKNGLIITKINTNDKTELDFEAKKEYLEFRNFSDMKSLEQSLKKLTKKQILAIDWEFLKKFGEQNWQKNDENNSDEVDKNKPKNQEIINNQESYDKILDQIVENRKQVFLKNWENGEVYRVLGSHKGAFLYTTGQRQNLNLSGGPWFVAKINTVLNLVWVVNQIEQKEIYCTKIIVKNINWQNKISKMK